MMGVVYLAEDPVLGRAVALKTVSLGFAVSEKERVAFRARFLTEAQAAARLSHPGIVVVYDVGVDSATGELFMALEYLKGQTLDALLAGERPLEWRQALRVAQRVAQALHHAHSNGIVHRDIKPANIMLLESGEPKIMDFGIAKVPTAQLTATGQVLGSPSYMSPERAREQPVDARSDLFSLGAVLYELLTGKRAFPGADVAGILLKVAYENPPPPGLARPGLPPDLDVVLARALAKDPDDRYPDGDTMAEDLEDIIEGRSPRHHAAWVASPSRTTLAGGPAPAASPTPASAEGTARGPQLPSLALPPGKRVCLAILDGPRQGDIFALDRPQILIGRAGGGAGAHLELPDGQISRAHAVVECHGPRVVVRDLNSTNGTHVAERRIAECEIEDRAEFRVGRTRLMLILTEQD